MTTNATTVRSSCALPTEAKKPPTTGAPDSAGARPTVTPTTSDPSSAPGIEPSPPISAATNPGSACNGKLNGSSVVTAESRMPATAASAPPIIHATWVVRSGLTPISPAASRLEAAPLIARPSRVNWNSANSAMVSTIEVAIRPSWP